MDAFDGIDDRRSTFPSKKNNALKKSETSSMTPETKWAKDFVG